MSDEFVFVTRRGGNDWDLCSNAILRSHFVANLLHNRHISTAISIMSFNMTCDFRSLSSTCGQKLDYFCSVALWHHCHKYSHITVKLLWLQISGSVSLWIEDMFFYMNFPMKCDILLMFIQSWRRYWSHYLLQGVSGHCGYFQFSL